MRADNATSRDRALTAIVVVALVVRLAYWLSKWSAPLQLNDSIYYSGQAYQLVHGHFFRELFVNQPGAEHGPLTAVLMAPLTIGASYVRWQRLVTVAAGVTTVWAIGRCTRRIAGRRVALIAAGIAAVYPNLWMNDGLVMSESVSILLVVLSLWAAHVAATSPGRRPLVLLGVALGLATLARSELVLLAPLVLLWLVVARRRAAGKGSPMPWRPVVLAGVTAVAVVLPWVTFNVARFERPVTLSTNDGTTLIGANCDDMYHGGNTGGWTVLCVLADPQYSPAEEPSVRSARERSIGLHYVRDHLGELPRVMVARAGRSLDLYGLRDMLHQDVGEERPRWAAWAGIVAFWALAVLAVVGARRMRRRDRWLLLAPVLVSAITTVAFYGGHRIRSSAEPSIVIFAALAVGALIDRTRGREAADE